MRHFFIINPHSFDGKPDRLKRVTEQIRGCFGLSEYGRAYRIHKSRYPRDAISVIHKFMNAIPEGETARVYAVGGDGTLFDCLNGIVDFPSAELTAVPYGGTNDFVRSFGEKAAEKFRDIKKLLNAPSKPADIIRCGSMYAINEVAFGIEAQSVMAANAVFRHPNLKILRNFAGAVYTCGAVGSISNKEIRLQKYTVRIDSEEFVGNYCNISVSNAACNGGNLFASPYAKPNDGLLDVIFAESGGILSVASAIGNYTKGKFEKNKCFFMRRVREMELESDKPIRVHMDGESFYADKISLEVLPSRVRVFAPDNMDFEDYSHIAYNAAKRRPK